MKERITRTPRSSVESILREQATSEITSPLIESERNEKTQYPLVARLRRFREALAEKHGESPTSPGKR